ncbi:MAG: RHS repeat-associated core domain-containing protein [Myxococcota bacterium]
MRGYDVANRLTREQRGREITRFEYDRNDNLAKLEDAQGRGIGYEYDARNRLTLTTFADSTRSERTYFGDDRVATFRDRAGNTFVYDYDDARRLSELSVKPGSDFNASTVKRTFRYDGLGRLIGAQAFGGSTNTATSQTSLGYNAVDTRLSEAQDGLALSVAQNGFGERRSIAYTDDWGVGLTIARDTRGFATSINGTGVFAGLGYSASDFLERVSFGNGAVSTRLPNSAREEQSRSLTLGDGEGALERVRAVVDRDPDGRIASITRRFQRSDRFAYTPNERWLSRAELDVVGDDVETAEAVIELDYDASGNLTRFSSAPTVIGYETNDLNQYTKVGPAELGYDTNGNLRFDGELSFSYDAFGQLTDIARNGTALAQYAYDALGRLRRRGYAGGRIEELLYDGDQLVAVRDAEGNRLRAYIYQPDAVDVPLALVTGDQTYYYELDASGSVVALVDGAGQVIERVRYDAFGRPTLTDGNAIPRDESIVGNELLFQGRPYDPVTGLYNNRARWYSARLGRFLTPDPLGPIDGVNTYA